MKKNILFVILDQYADWESAYLSPWICTLGKDKCSVKTVSLTKDPIKSIGGFTTIPDYDILSAPLDFEGLVLIGGNSWRNDNTEQIKPLVQHALDNKKVVAGICDATTFLGKMGVLNNVEHTSNLLDDLKNWCGETYTGENKYIMKQAVRDGKIITANGTASLDFAKEVMIALEIVPESKIVEWYNFLKLGAYEAPYPTA